MEAVCASPSRGARGAPLAARPPRGYVGAVRIRSWNVNGLRAAMKKGLPQWLAQTAPDIVGLQEVRAQRDQLDAELAALSAWSVHLSSAERKGWSGTALLSLEIRRPNLETVFLALTGRSLRDA